MIRVVVFRVGQPGSVEFIDGGDLECVRLSWGADLWCNADGRNLGLPYNRSVADRVEESHDVYGPFFLARSEGPEMAGLTDADVEALLRPAMRAVSWEALLKGARWGHA